MWRVKSVPGPRKSPRSAAGQFWVKNIQRLAALTADGVQSDHMTDERKQVIGWGSSISATHTGILVNVQ